MEEKLNIDLGTIQKTLLKPLWGRSKEYENKNPLIKDKYAYDIVHRLNFDFSSIGDASSAYLQINSSIRAYIFDNEIRNIIETFPDATIVNIGSGLDTAFHRVDNGKIFWYDLDLEDTIQLRRKLIPEGERNKIIAKSVFDRTWFKDVKIRGSKIFIISAGVLAYFNENDIKSLFLDLIKEFPDSEITFEIYSKIALWIHNLGAKRQKHQNQFEALINWAPCSSKSISRWSNKIEIIDEYPFYSKVRLEDHWDKKYLFTINLVKFLNAIKVIHLKFKGNSNN